MAQKSYKQFINENSLYQTPAEKMDFESDDAKIINAFYYSFVGPVGYLHAATKKQRVVQYFKSDKQLRIKNITDDNNDVSLIIKTMNDKGFFKTQQTANEITRFLVKARSGQIDDVNEDIIRGWINQVKPDKKLKALPLIRKKVEEFIGGGSLAALAVELRNTAKRRGFGDGEFYKTTKNLKMDPNKLVSKAASAAPTTTTTPTPAQIPPVTPTSQPATTTVQTQQPVSAPSQTPQSAQSTQGVDLKEQEKIIGKISADYKKVAEFLNKYVTDDEKLEAVYNAGLTNPKVLFPRLLAFYRGKTRVLRRTPIVKKLVDRVFDFLLKMDFAEIVDNLNRDETDFYSAFFHDFLKKVVSTKKEDAAKIFAKGSTTSYAIWQTSKKASYIYVSYEDDLMDLYKDFMKDVAPTGFVTDENFLSLVPESVKIEIGLSDNKAAAALEMFIAKSAYNNEYKWDVKEFKDVIGDDPKDLYAFEKLISVSPTIMPFQNYIGRNSRVGWVLESQLRAVENATPEYIITNFFNNYYTRNRLDVDPRVLSAILKKSIQYLENAELFDKKANDGIYSIHTKAEDESLEDAIRPSMRKIVLKHIQEYLRVGLENYDAYKGLAGLLSTRHTKLQDSRYFKYLNAEDISGFVDIYIENPDDHESIPLPSFSELSDRQKNVIFRRVFNSYNNEVYPEDSEPASRVHQLYDEEFVEALRVIDLDALSFYQKSGFVDRVAPSDNSIENMPPDEAKKAYQTKTKFYSKLFGSMDKDDQILFANQNVFANIRNIRSIISSEEVLDETVDAVVQKSLVDSIPEIGKTRYNTNYGLSALAGTLKDVSYQDETPERVYRVFEAVVRGVEERKLNKNSNVYREVFADIETSALLYAETKRDKFEEFYKSLGAGMKKQISRSYIEARGSATTVRAAIHDESAIIKPYQKLDNAAIRKALKYNNISAAQANIPASATKDLASMEAFADSFSEGIIEKQHIAEVETPEAELDRISVDLHRKNRTNRHGRNSIKVLRVLNVAIPKQVEGQKVWDEEHPGQEKIDPMFHGTNAVAAAMITRFGFSVGKNAVNGRMLGDGIYGSNAIDKAQLYVGDKYGKGSTGVRGYVFVMDASLGKKNEDYKAAGLSDSKDNIRSPEWCVFTPNSQFRIYKAYEVEIVSKGDMDILLEDNPPAQYNESTRPIRFSKFLREYSMDKVEYPDVMTFTFMNGNIPVKGPDGKPTYVDFEDFKPTNKSVSLEPSAYGPTVVITDTEESEDYRFKSPTDLLMQDEELFNKFLELTS